MARNAIKHGLLAREVVITAGDGEETVREFHTLVDGLYEYHQPVGAVEEMLVQTIATCWWRKARVLRSENGEIRKRLDMLRVDLELRNSDKGNLDLALLKLKDSSDLHWFANHDELQDIQSGVRGNRLGLFYLNALLEKAKSQIASEGHIPDEIREKLYLAFCFWDHLFALRCFNADSPEDKPEDTTSENVKDQRTIEQNAFMVALIDYQLKKIEQFMAHASKRERLQPDAEARAGSLPPADAADKLLRYEAHLDRQLYRAMDQLERLQRQRRGENVPPPLNINLGKRS